MFRRHALVGWSFTIAGYPLTFTSIQTSTVDNDHVQTSLRVPFDFKPGFDASGIVTFYAAQPDAVTLFAIDIAAALHVAQDELQLNQDLNPTLVAGITGLAEWQPSTGRSGCWLSEARRSHRRTQHFNGSHRRPRHEWFRM